MNVDKKNKDIKPDKKSINLLEKLFHDKKFKELEIETKKLIEKYPKIAMLHNILGLANQKQGRLNDAISNFEKAILINPNFAFAHNNLGNVLKDLKKFDDAIKSYKKSLNINPKYVDPYYNQGLLYKKINKYEDSIKNLKLAINLNPNLIEAYMDLGAVLTNIGKFDEAIENYQKVLDLKPNLNWAYSNIFFTLYYLEKDKSDYYFSQIKKFRSSLEKINKNLIEKYQFNPKPDKLKIGFISGDFKQHPVGYLLKDTLKYLKKNNLKLFAYSNLDKEDNYSIKLKTYFSSWNKIYNKTDTEIVNKIRKDGIHILIDLSGHSAKNRLPIFINKPAPIQITWGGYPGSTGIPEIDYIIGDPYVTPTKSSEKFTEKICRLPNIWISLTTPEYEIKIKELPAIKNGYVTFGSFNNLSKVNDSVVFLWSKILKKIPKSKILFKSKVLNDPEIKKKLINNFKKNNINSNSIILEGNSPRKISLESYNKVDIALDPFPYSGAITTFEAIWMGVPVITKKGEKFVSRQTESINHNIGMSDWIAKDEKEYIDKAIMFSSNIEKLSKIRTGLRKKALDSPTFNSSLFADNFNNLLWKLWENFKIKLNS